MGFLLRFIKNLVITALVLAVIGLIGGLVYLNQIGFPGHYGDWLRSELSQRGIEVEFDSLRFSPRSGLIVTNAKFFVQKEDLTPALTANYISIDIDKSLAIRGQFELREIFISGGSAMLEMKDSEESLAAENINAEIFLQEDGNVRIREAKFLVEGFAVNLDADLKLPTEKETTEPKPRNDQALKAILRELALWKIPTERPPEISLQLRGDLNDPARIRTEFEIEAHDLVRNDYALGTIVLHGELRDELATVEKILLADDSGEAEGKADWNMRQHKGRFELSSSIDIKNFLKTCFDVEVMGDLTSEDPPFLQVQGEIIQRDDQGFSVDTSGFAELGPFHFLEHPYESLSSQFSWRDGDLYLQDLVVSAEERSLRGDLLMKGNLIQYRVKSDLPLTAFSPFIKKDSPTDKIIERFKFEKDSTLAVELEGHINRSHSKDVSATGSIQSTKLNYRGISLHELSSDFVITPEKIEFTSIRTQLDDREEEARLRFGGAASEPILTDRIQIDLKTRITYISNLRGTFWPTPVVRAFAPETAAYLLKNYRFHQPPSLTLTGAFTGYKDRPEDSHFLIALRTSGETGYPFLGKTLPVNDLRADITMKGLDLKIERLAFASLKGIAAGQINVQIKPEQDTSYQGDIRWDRVSFPELSKVYQFDEVEQGTLVGRIQFSGAGGNVRNLNAKGGLELKAGNLVALPVLGPLSPLMAGVLGDKRMGYERAKNANAHFEIVNGVWKTADFQAFSENITLTGNGWVDLDTKKMDLTVRANVRGLLGIVAIPLSPFKGLLQFRGTGLFTDSKWQAAAFTAPISGEMDPIFRKTIR